MKPRFTFAVLFAAALATACGADRTDRDDRDRSSADDRDDVDDGSDGSDGDGNTIPARPGEPTDDEDPPDNNPTPPPSDNDDDDEPRPEPPPAGSACEAAGVTAAGTCVQEPDGSISVRRCDANGEVEEEYCGTSEFSFSDGCAVKGGRAQCIAASEVHFRREQPWLACYEQGSGAYAYTLAFADGAVAHYGPDETMTAGTFEFSDGSIGITVDVPGVLDGVGYVFGQYGAETIVLDAYGDGKECYAAYYEDTPGIDVELYCDSYNVYLDSNFAHTFDFDPWGAFTVTESGEFGTDVYPGAYFIDGERVVATYYATATSQFELEFLLVGNALVPVNLEDDYDFHCD